MQNNRSIHHSPVKVKDFQTVDWTEAYLDKNEAGQEIVKHRQIIVLYALGEDGVVYEYNSLGWRGFPIQEDTLREPKPEINAQPEYERTKRTTQNNPRR